MDFQELCLSLHRSVWGFPLRSIILSVGTQSTLNRTTLASPEVVRNEGRQSVLYTLTPQLRGAGELPGTFVKRQQIGWSSKCFERSLNPCSKFLAMSWHGDRGTAQFSPRAWWPVLHEPLKKNRPVRFSSPHRPSRLCYGRRANYRLRRRPFYHYSWTVTRADFSLTLPLQSRNTCFLTRCLTLWMGENAIETATLADRET